MGTRVGYRTQNTEQIRRSETGYRGSAQVRGREATTKSFSW